jgi:antirestriction protein
MEELKIDPEDREAFTIYCEYYHQHQDETLKEDFQESFQGSFQSEAEFSEHLFDGCDDSYDSLNDILKKCIDWGEVWAFALQYDYAFSGGYVFLGI